MYFEPEYGCAIFNSEICLDFDVVSVTLASFQDTSAPLLNMRYLHSSFILHMT